MAWYASFGEQILGKLDPKTAKVTEYPIPLLKPDAPTGILGMRFDHDQNLWLGMQFQGGIAKFDKKTEKFQTWSLPPELNGDHVQINQVSPDRHHIDGKVWLQDAGTYTVLRLDVATGTFEVFEPYKIPRPNVYDVIPDSQNNGFFLVMGAEDVGKIDAKTGKIDDLQDADARVGTAARDDGRAGSPLVRREPRRQDRDVRHADRRRSRSGRRRRRARGPTTSTVDKNGEVWSGGEYNDRILRLNPKTGRIHRVSAAAADQRPARLRRQLDDAGHILGREQPRRVDREAGAARWRQVDRPDRRRFLAGALASLGCGGGLWRAIVSRPVRTPGRALTQSAAKPHRIDIHHHFAPPAWVVEVKGRPLLQAANTTWTPAKSIEDMDRGGVAAASCRSRTPGLWFGDAAATTAVSRARATTTAPRWCRSIRRASACSPRCRCRMSTRR